uniref:Uncharacterized protein n=1 Tax=Lates calcarifer TaxID=8187 RepID=A0A4W6BSZ3_LATCA
APNNSWGQAKGRAFYQIPNDPERPQKWITAIKRARCEQKKTGRWEPTGNEFHLCSMIHNYKTPHKYIF